MNRFIQQQIPDNDKDKFELAVDLLAKKMENDGVPVEVVMSSAFAIVSDVMRQTNEMREYGARIWELFNKPCLN